MPGMDGFINFNGTLEGSIAGGGGGDVADVKVRDSQESTFESVVNEQGVAEIDLISYVRRNELTQAIENIENSIDNVEQLVDTKQNIINFSTVEQNTGQKWTDNKNLFVKTFQGHLIISTNNRKWYDLISNLSYMDKVFVMPESYIELSDAIINIPYTSYYNNVGAVVGVNFDTPTNTFQLLIGGLPTGTYSYEITLKYTRSI